MTSKIVDRCIWVAVGVTWFGVCTWALCTI